MECVWSLVCAILRCAQYGAHDVRSNALLTGAAAAQKDIVFLYYTVEI